ncbi:MAG: hypothetical protein AAF194_10025 [Pseudomonadota bacterium]
MKDRTRNSGLTSVTFLGRDRFVCCDFNEKRAYFAELKRGELRVIDSHPTVVSGGDAVQTDLIDSRDNEFVVSNFYQGSASCYRINQNKIEFVGEVNRAGPRHPYRDWTPLSDFLHHEPCALERSNETTET